MVRFCKNSGVMFSTGALYPDKIVAGNIKTKTRSMACCCVLQNEEMKSPTPEIEIKNQIRAKK